MSFVSTLLQAMVRLDGEAVVIHVGEKPYVVTLTSQVDLATRGLSLEAVIGIVDQILPLELIKLARRVWRGPVRAAGTSGAAGRTLHRRRRATQKR